MTRPAGPLDLSGDCVCPTRRNTGPFRKIKGSSPNGRVLRLLPHRGDGDGGRRHRNEEATVVIAAPEGVVI
jgi:hypothetical protein